MAGQRKKKFQLLWRYWKHKLPRGERGTRERIQDRATLPRGTISIIPRLIFSSLRPLCAYYTRRESLVIKGRVVKEHSVEGTWLGVICRALSCVLIASHDGSASLQLR